MKSPGSLVALTLIGLLAALVPILYADTFSNHKIGNASGNTLTVSVDGGLVTIPQHAIPIVKDAQGNILNPQPMLRITPKLGTQAVEYKIKVLDDGFPPGGSVTFPMIETNPRNGPRPKGLWSNE